MDNDECAMVLENSDEVDLVGMVDLECRGMGKCIHVHVSKLFKYNTNEYMVVHVIL